MRLKAWTTRLLVALLAFIAGIAVTHLSLSRQRTISVQVVNPADIKPVQAINPWDDKTLIFEGVVLKIGPPVPGSGIVAFYRLVKYRVDRVTYGHYEAHEIVVDHLSLSTHELDGLEEGSRVRVAVERSQDISLRNNAEGIREENDCVDTFYLGRAVSRFVLSVARQ